MNTQNVDLDAMKKGNLPGPPEVGAGYFGMVVFLMAGLALVPELALASSSGISEFVSAPRKVLETVTGPLGHVVSVFAMAGCGIFFVMNKDDLTGALKLLLTVALGISFIPFAADIVNFLYGWSGALV